MILSHLLEATLVKPEHAKDHAVQGTGTTAQPSAPIRRLVRLAPQAGAWIAITLAVLTLVGWQFRVDWLKNPFASLGSTYMPANAALCFILCGIALLALERPGRIAAVVRTGASLFVLVFSLLTLAEFIGGWNFGIDTIFFHHRLSDWTIAGNPPGRFALNAAIAFPLVALAILFRDSCIGWRRASDWLALVANYSAFLNFIGHAYHVEGLKGLGTSSRMAMHGAIAFSALTFGILLKGPEYGIAAPVVSRDSEGSIVRRLLVTIGIGFPILGWLALQAQGIGLTDMAADVAFLVIVGVTILSLFVFNTAASLRRANQERKLASEVLRLQKEALHKANERLSRALDGSHSGVWELDLRTNLVWWSDQMFQLRGLEPAPARTLEKGLSAVDERDRPLVENAIRQCSEQRTDVRFEYRVKHATLGERWMETSARTYYDERGTPLHMIGVTLDVTSRKLTELALRDSESRFRALFEHASVGIEQVSPDGRLLLVNDALCKMLGYSEEELTCCTFVDITHPEDRGKEADLLDSMFRGEREAITLEKRYVRRDGSPVYVQVHSRLVRDTDERPAYRISIVHDITERRHAEQAMLTAEKLAAAGKLAAALAHEINNPLMAISNVSHLLLMNKTLDANTKELVSIADRELQRVSEITNRTLMFSRSRSEAQQVRVFGLLDDMLELYAGAIRRNRIEVERRYRFEGEAVVDGGLIKQIFANVVANSLDAMPNGGRLLIDLYSNASRCNGKSGALGLRIVVGDTGTGITKEHLARMFEPFHTTKGEKGTGLGLWVSRGLLIKAGGSIDIKSSTRQNHSGTVVSIFVPCSLKEHGTEVIGIFPDRSE